jgi:ABC-type amino acid transport substrate-binding protein
MFRMTMKDVALVAFAGGLLVFELAGLQAAAPTVLRTLAGATGLHQVRNATRATRVATESMLDGFSVAAAQAAVGAVEGAAERVVAATPVMRSAAAPVRVRPACGYVLTVRERGGAAQRVRPAYGYVLTVGDRNGARQRVHARLVTWRAERCRADVRTILSHRASDAVRRTIEITNEGSSEASTQTSSEASSF